MDGQALLQMARAARSVPAHYKQIKQLIHQLRLEQKRTKHFEVLFKSQSERLFQAAKERDMLSYNIITLLKKSALVD